MRKPCKHLYDKTSQYLTFMFFCISLDFIFSLFPAMAKKLEVLALNIRLYVNATTALISQYGIRYERVRILHLTKMALLIPVLSGCVQGVPDDEEAKTWELYRTLAYYKYVERDTLKYAAARYLIDNMQYHYPNACIYKDNDTLARWQSETDSIYYSFVRGCTMADFPWDTLWHVKKAHREVIEADTLPDAIVDHRRLCDLNELGFDFLTDHIDNVFRACGANRRSRRI